MNMRPLGERVVIKKVEAESTTKSGIVLPGQAKEQPQMAKVLAVGPGTKDVEMIVKVGDKVIYPKFTGTDVKFEGEEFIIIEQSKLLAIVD